MRPSPIREFALRAILWLPLSFVLWFYFAGPLAWPVVQLTKGILLTLWPQLFEVVIQFGHTMEVTTRIWVSQVNPNGQSEIGALVLTLNPMVYGYALPLFAGLVMATPLVAARRALQLLLALGFVWLAQSLGTTAEVLKILGFESGPAGVAAIAKQGLSLEAIALVYQFSYLILPAVLPVALWIGLNRDFIETLIRPATEP